MTSAEPMIVEAIRRDPFGELKATWPGGGALGTSGQGFLAEYDEAIAAAEERGRAAAEAKLVNKITELDGRCARLEGARIDATAPGAREGYVRQLSALRNRQHSLSIAVDELRKS
jgi:hypothetical protein